MIQRRSRWQRIKDKVSRKSRKAAGEVAGEGAGIAAEGFFARIFGRSGGGSWFDGFFS